MSYEHDRNGFGKVSSPPTRKYIRYGGYLWLIFLKMRKRNFSETLNTEKKAQISSSKVTSKKGFLKTTRRLFLWFIVHGSASTYVLWQSYLFLMTRGIDWCKLKYQTMSKKVYTAGNLRIIEFCQKVLGTPQNCSKWKIIPKFGFWNPFFFILSLFVQTHLKS